MFVLVFQICPQSKVLPPFRLVGVLLEYRMAGPQPGGWELPDESTALCINKGLTSH
jgi:hypothetical protein